MPQVLKPSLGLSVFFCKMGPGLSRNGDWRTMEGGQSWACGRWRGEGGALLGLETTPHHSPGSCTLSPPQRPLATYLLTDETQRHRPVHEGHDQHHEVVQQPEALLELGPPHQVALQEGRWGSGGQAAMQTPAPRPAGLRTDKAGVARAQSASASTEPPRDSGSRRLSSPPHPKTPGSQ